MQLVLKRLLTQQQQYKTGENTRSVASAGKNEIQINEKKTLTRINGVQSDELITKLDPIH